MNAEIIQLILCPRHNREQTDFPTIVFRSAVPDDLMMDHVDMAGHEHAGPDIRET
jgi:hypothetical protein